MSHAESRQVADRLKRALEALDVDALGELYADDAAIWHNFDEREQTPEQNLKAVRWMKRTLADFTVSDFRQDILDDGFVQYHVISGSDPEISAPCLLRAWCAGGKITRIEEFTDSAAFGPLIPARVPPAETERPLPTAAG